MADEFDAGHGYEDHPNPDNDPKTGVMRPRFFSWQADEEYRTRWAGNNTDVIREFLREDGSVAAREYFGMPFDSLGSTKHLELFDTAGRKTEEFIEIDGFLSDEPKIILLFIEGRDPFKLRHPDGKPNFAPIERVGARHSIFTPEGELSQIFYLKTIYLGEQDEDTEELTLSYAKAVFPFPNGAQKNAYFGNGDVLEREITFAEGPKFTAVRAQTLYHTDEPIEGRRTPQWSKFYHDIPPRANLDRPSIEAHYTDIKVGVGGLTGFTAGDQFLTLQEGTPLASYPEQIITYHTDGKPKTRYNLALPDAIRAELETTPPDWTGYRIHHPKHEVCSGEQAMLLGKKMHVESVTIFCKDGEIGKVLTSSGKVQQAQWQREVSTLIDEALILAQGQEPQKHTR